MGAARKDAYAEQGESVGLRDVQIELFRRYPDIMAQTPLNRG
jgi:hypothetical protein